MKTSSLTAIFREVSTLTPSFGERAYGSSAERIFRKGYPNRVCLVQSVDIRLSPGACDSIRRGDGRPRGQRRERWAVERGACMGRAGHHGKCFFHRRDAGEDANHIPRGAATIANASRWMYSTGCHPNGYANRREREKPFSPQGTQWNAEDGRLRHTAAGLPAVMSERVSGYQEIGGRPSRPPFDSACPVRGRREPYLTPRREERKGDTIWRKELMQKS